MTCQSIRIFSVAAAALAVAAGASSSAALADSDLYVGFTALDPEAETRTPNAYIVVQDGIITAAGAGTPPVDIAVDAVHDMSGLFALPGFIDAHAHITQGPQNIVMEEDGPVVTMESDDAITPYMGRWALAYGVTTVRNPGGDPEANARYDANVASGEWLGPEAFHAGAVIQPPPFGGSAFAYPQTEEEWDAEAARQAALGMTYFKLYVGLSEDELASGIRAAHAHGLQAIAHLDQVSWTRAIELGVDGLEHALATSPDLLEPAAREIYVTERDFTSKYMYRWYELADYDGPLIQELFNQLAAEQVATNMTLIVNELVYNADDAEAYMARITPNGEPSVDDLPGPFRELTEFNLTQLGRSTTGWSDGDHARARAVLPKVLEFARRIHAAGAPMMVGTDGPGGGVYYARELELHVQAGIPAWEVLRMATSRTADILGIGDRTGRLAVGYEADVAFLDADPSLDPGDAYRVRAVLTNGDFHQTDDLKGEMQ
ncbi:MAG: amidohydrolase family protein [Maricaulaceae bacterium]|jgi:imidazolonepropionase-like amidohydrolase